MNDERQTITLHISGNPEKGDKVSVKALSKVLNTVQAAITHIGKAETRLDGRRTGRLPKELRTEFELFVVETKPGSLVATLELPKPQTDMFSERDNLNRTVVRKFSESARIFATGRFGELNSVIPDDYLRGKVFHNLMQLVPDKRSPYRVEITFEGETPISLELPPDDVIDEFRALTIEASGTQESGIESMANLRCLVAINPEREPSREDIKSIIDYEIETASSELYRLEDFVYSDNLFSLHKPLTIEILTEDDLFVIDYHHLDVSVHGDSRESAILSFKEEISYLWFEYGLLPDSELLGFAVTLKRRILELVKRVESIEGPKN